jgi:hypothetical protein
MIPSAGIIPDLFFPNCPCIIHADLVYLQHPAFLKNKRLTAK